MKNGTDDKSRHDHAKTRHVSPEKTEGKAVESLLKLASARPEPSVADREAIRTAVKGEWQAVAGKRKLRRRVGAFAIAASVLLVMTIVVLKNGETPGTIDLQQMATVERITGRVEVVGTQTGQNTGTLGQQMPVYVGQTLKTASESGMALILETGISLRVDELTVVEFVSDNSMKLSTGRVYVDTHAGAPSDDQGAAARFEILTDQGSVRHLGTQYMVLKAEDNLSVSVREGRVHVIADAADGPATMLVRNGMELSVEDHGASEVFPTDVFGNQWQWAENLGSGFVLDSRTIAEFLEWVARETGREIEYESAMARSVAEETVLHGTVDLPAREALDLVLMTSDLSATMVGGVIEIRIKE